MYVASTGQLIEVGSRIASNIASEAGGAYFLVEDSAYLYDILLEENIATSGGAIFISYDHYDSPHLWNTTLR